MARSSLLPPLFGVCFLLLICVSPESALCAFISSVESISFGTIIADPLGDVVEIDASSGPTVPILLTAGNAIVTGGSSGRITVFSDIPGQMISLVYPASFTISQGGSTMTVDGIMARSQFFATSTAVGDIHFYVGGLLHVNLGQSSHTYSGAMTVTVDIVNP